MVQENVETLKIVDDEKIQQLDAETTQPPDDEMPVTLEEQAQHVAIEQGYFDGSIPSDISAPSGLSPKRAELARFLEWHSRTAAELEQLKVAHHRAIGLGR
jgi:hypothetical protein